MFVCSWSQVSIFALPTGFCFRLPVRFALQPTAKQPPLPAAAAREPHRFKNKMKSAI
ncbi:hypothetical protein [Methanimicrococcus hongohii]|uniref:hypothetical protein n=1 Tax=Methanimicrococcus hongohii TaxID=3028295 RepID=UPI00292ED1F9|nr:hypothetical protein [Methanimicrococcus sp. Hf6]